MGHSVTIEIAEDEYANLQKIAQTARLPIEKLLGRRHPRVLLIEEYPDDADEIEMILVGYTDDQLGATANEKLAVSEERQLDYFSENSATLSGEEQTARVRLVEKWGKWVLIRSVALKLLHQRGFDVHRFLNKR